MPAPSIARLEDRWQALSKVLNTFVADKDRDVVELRIRDLDLLDQQIAHGASQAQLRRALASWRLEPVERPLARLGNYARTLATRMGKAADLDVVIVSGGTRLAPQVWAPIWSNMIHVVRNAVDHGIESPSDRQRAGKPIRPRLRLAADIQDGHLVIEIEDDGAGIDWEAVRTVARRRGLPDQSQADLTRALFTADVSTRTAVSTTSGRGIGLAALAHQVEGGGGSLAVRSVAGQGTCFRFTFPVSEGTPVFETARSEPAGAARVVA